MINEPRTYRHPIIQVVILLVVFGILAVGLFSSLNTSDYTPIIPLQHFL